jgi:glycosyltransferase involved in cell wall biosynthesis
VSRPRLALVVESGTDVRLIEGLAERFDLSVAARRIPGGVEISQAPGTPVPVDVLPPGRARFAAAVPGWLRRRAARADAVLVQGYGPAALAANLAGRRSGIPTFMLVCSPVEAYYACRRRPGSGKRYRAAGLLGLRTLARLNARIGTGYIVLSEHLATVVRGHGTSAPIHVVPVYGVDTRAFSPGSEDRRAVRARRGIPPAGSVAFFSSRVAPEKDAESVLLALRLLVARGRDVRVLHRSGGFRRFQALAAEIGVANHVIASDAAHPHRELPDDYRACDVCVQASHAEGLGFSPLEAMACGVPVVATAVGGLAETVRDGDTGWTYPDGDADALAARIEDVLDNRAEGARRAARGREMVVERFERRVVFGRLEEILEG